MKRIALSISLVAMGLVAVCQTLTTIKTPTNVTIEAIIVPEFSVYELAIIEADAAYLIADEGWDVVRVGRASQSYNCHNYAWHNSDGGTRRWLNQQNVNGGANISKYWSGTAPSYTATTASWGTKVFYPAPAAEGGDHSAIVIAPGVFRSKWGAFPLYEHPPTHCPYNATGLQYFHIPVGGNEVICTSGSYSTLNVSTATYSWTGSSNINVSGSNGANAVATRVSDGTAWIQCQISSPFSGTTVKTEKRNVWVGTSPPVQPLVHYDLGLNAACKGHTHTASTAQHPGVTDYRWRLIYPDGFSWDLPSGSRSTTFCIDDTGWYAVAVKQRIEGCSWSGEVQRSFAVENCGTGERCGGGGLVPRLIVSPNPVSHELTIAEVEPANDHIPWTLRLMSQRGAVMVNVTATLPKTINVQGLQPGVYILHARRGRHVEQQVVIVE